jgi:hypothetical protein
MSKGGHAMKFVKACVATGLAFGIPFGAAAQQPAGTQPDIRYCNDLAKTYSSLWPAMEAMPAADAVAINRCNTDPRAAIAALEVKFRAKKIELPPHEAVAHQPGPTRPTQ